MDRSGGGAVDVTVHPGRLSGTIPAIPSKSAAHRLLILAALADGKTDIACPAVSKDILATANCLAALGAEIERRPWGFSVTPGKAPKRADLPCGESGSTLRFLLPVAAALGVEATFHLEGRLPKRPLAPLDGQLTAHGVTLTRPTEDTLRCAGKLEPGGFTLPGNVSSQYITGLLLALPLLSGTSTLTVTGQVESAPYIALTEEALSQFGALPEKTNWQYEILPRRYQSPGKARVEGDWSNAAFFLAAGASVTGLDMESSQGDRAILELLRRFGASVTVAEDTAAVSWDQLHGIDIDAAAIPDLVPILAVLAAVAEGKNENLSRPAASPQGIRPPRRRGGAITEFRRIGGGHRRWTSDPGHRPFRRQGGEFQRPPHRHGRRRGGDAGFPAGDHPGRRGRGEVLPRLL